MADLEIRPTLRFIRLGYAAVGLLAVGAAIWWLLQPGSLALSVLAAAVVLLLWPAAHHLERQRTRCRLAGGHLRYEQGIFSTTVKTIPAAKIQDVTVKRSLLQKIWGVGDLRIETAGHASTLEIRNVEAPEELARRILEAAG